MDLKDIETREIMPGLHGKIVHGENITWAFWKAEKDTQVPLHQHENEQIMHVLDGEIELTLMGKTKIYRSGSVVIIPSNEPHSAVALTKCELMDVFSPVREDYR
tara:strand:+ start:10321 stop:10632 length:312 start_codon:yes stop_codon:yes gene_type:complete